VLLVILLLSKYGKGFVANVSVLLGLVFGFVVALAMGKVKFDGLEQAEWFALVYPFQFGMPTFDLVSAATMCLVMIVVMVESLGMFLAWASSPASPCRPRTWRRACAPMAWAP
jgi:xanthine/uracil permease